MTTTIDCAGQALIARNEAEVFAEFAGKLADKNAVYDFTFLGRFMVYHYRHHGKVIYLALDKVYARSSRVLEVNEPLLVSEFKDILPKVLNSVKYTGFYVEKLYIC